MASCITPIPRTRVEWTVSGACISGSIAHPADATKRTSGGSVTTSTRRRRGNNKRSKGRRGGKGRKDRKGRRAEPWLRQMGGTRVHDVSHHHHLHGMRVFSPSQSCSSLSVQRS